MKIVNDEKQITTEDVVPFLAGANAAAQRLGHTRVPARIEITNIEGDEAMEGYNPLLEKIRFSIPNQHGQYDRPFSYDFFSFWAGAHEAVHAVRDRERTPPARVLHHITLPLAKLEAQVRGRDFHNTNYEELEATRIADEVTYEFDF